MNKIIKEQLKKCTTANIPSFDDTTTHLLIKKYSPLVINENSYYLIKIGDGVLHPSENSLLASNFNNGGIPNHSHYKCEVVKVLGTMIKIVGLAFDISTSTDLNEMWSGWLPLDEIEIIKKL